MPRQSDSTDPQVSVLVPVRSEGPSGSASLRAVVFLALVCGCSCRDDDSSFDGGTAADARADSDDASASRDSGTSTDAGDPADAGDADEPDGGLVATEWSEVDDVVTGARGRRIAMRGAPDGRVVVVFKDTSETEMLRAVRWHGGESGAWTDLGIVNEGVSGKLETGADPEFRYVGIGLFDDDRVLVAFRQGGAIHANAFDGSSFGTPRTMSDQAGALSVASDGNAKALLAYSSSDARVVVRSYDAVADDFGDEVAVDTVGRTLELPNAFVVLAGLAESGDALVASVDRPGATSYRVMTSRYSALDAEWVEETVAAFPTPYAPARICLAMSSTGVAVLSFAERFMNANGTFVRARAARRVVGDTGWGTWASFDGVPMHDACAASEDGAALVAALVATGTGANIVAHRFAQGAWAAGEAVGATLTTGSSRALSAMTSDGRAAIAYQFTSGELRLATFADGSWTSASPLAQTNPLDTNLDQFFKGTVALDDGRVLWVYQDSQARLRYVVNR